MISVVIPAFNEAEFLGACLHSLVLQATERPFEVIVVNNGSTDATVAVAEKFFNLLNLKIICEPNLGRGAARRAGFRASSGQIIFSTDADAVVPHDWIEQLASRLDTGDAVAVTGPARIADCSLATNFIFNFIQPFSATLYRLLLGHYWLPGFNFAILRTSYFAAGEFDAGMDALEDNDLARRVKELGVIEFVRSIPVTFSGRRFKASLARGLFDYAWVFIRYYFFGTRQIAWSNIR